MFKNLKFSALRSAFLVVLPLLLKLKFSFIGGTPTLSLPPLATFFPDLPHLAAAVLAWYELAVRLVPSVQNLSILKALMDLLDQIAPNHAITEDGRPSVHVSVDEVLPKDPFNDLPGSLADVPSDVKATGSGLALA